MLDGIEALEKMFDSTTIFTDTFRNFVIGHAMDIAREAHSNGFEEATALYKTWRPMTQEELDNECIKGT
jgi:hypothetical protein